MAPLTRKLISTDKAPRPVAPYSQAVVADRTVYVSGCVGTELPTQKLVTGGVAHETRQALQNLKIILEESGSSIQGVIKTTIFVQDLNEFAIVNEEYKKVFTHDFPARSCVQVARLPLDAKVEIEAIALIGDVKTVSA